MKRFLTSGCWPSGECLDESPVGDYVLFTDAMKIANALKHASDHLDYCGYGDSRERECARDDGLREEIEAALKLAGLP